MDRHPLCALFPELDPDAFKSLKADIQANGQRQAIITLGAEILDGWNRFRACQELGIRPIMTGYTGRDPLAYVLSANLHRRHLSESQRAAIAAQLANIKAGTFAGNQHVPSASLQTPQVSQAQAADMLQVSTRSVAAAAKVIATGAPELQEAVKSGAVSVSAAAAITSLPKLEQAQAVEHGRVAEVAKQVRQQNQPATDEPLRTAQVAHQSRPPVERVVHVEVDPAPTVVVEHLDDGQTDADRLRDLADDLDREMAENQQLQARIASLTKADLPAEIDRLNLRVQQLDLHVRSVQQTLHEATKQAKYQGAVLKRIREALAVERDRDILPAIAALKGGAS
jgi:hypothetical protein